MRALSQLEQALTITNSVYPLSAVNVLKLAKGPSLHALQFSIDRLQEQYPFLRSFIKEKDGRYWFEKDRNKRPVQVQLIERRDDDQWLEIARLELNMGFDHCTPPLMRALYLKSSAKPGKSEIILSFHHAIMDSAFVMPFINQLLTLAGEEEAEVKNASHTILSAYTLPIVEGHIAPFLPDASSDLSPAPIYFQAIKK